MEIIEFKRGSTFAITCTFVDLDTMEPLSIASLDIAAQLRTPDDELVATLTVVKLEAGESNVGVFTAEVPFADTSAWDFPLAFDFQITEAGRRVYTDTVGVDVDRNITRIA